MSTYWSHLNRLALCSTFAACLAVAGVGPAQDEAQETPEAPAAAAADSKNFAETFEEWKAVLEELRDVQARYPVAPESEEPQLKEKWSTLMAQAEALLPKLRTAGIKTYLDEKGENRDLERFLIKLLDDDIARDNYEPATELASALIDGGCKVSRVLDSAGVAAFATNQFEKAQTYFDLAKESGNLSDAAVQFQTILDDYVALWEKENELREKEAAADDLPRVKLTTSKGDIILELFENEAPDTVGNFVKLVEDGFYEGLAFHRVLKGFMAQGGCPLGTGSGGPGYNIPCECYEPGARMHFRGSLSMAHAGRDTGGSQFFLTFLPTPHLNGKHTCFGRIVDGMDVLAKIRRVEPGASGVIPDKIEKAEVLRKRDHAYEPKKVN